MTVTKRRVGATERTPKAQRQVPKTSAEVHTARVGEELAIETNGGEVLFGGAECLQRALTPSARSSQQKNRAI